MEFGSFFALLLGLGRPVRRLMWHHDAVAAVRRRGRLQEPVDRLLPTLLGNAGQGNPASEEAQGDVEALAALQGRRA